jgi:hypothetical protein
MSGYDTTNKLPAKAQNDTYFFLKELEKEIAALREENAELRAKAIIWRRWPEEKPGERGWYLGGFIHPTYFDFMKLFYSDGHFNDDSLDYWAEIPRPEGEDGQN